jgi:hypothetical protein
MSLSLFLGHYGRHSCWIAIHSCWIAFIASLLADETGHSWLILKGPTLCPIAITHTRFVAGFTSYFAMVNKQVNHRSEHAPLQLLQASNEPLDAPKPPVSGSNAGRSQLGVDFKPSCYSVICGRGKGRYVTFDYDSRERWMQYAMHYIYKYTKSDVSHTYTLYLTATTMRATITSVSSLKRA